MPWFSSPSVQAHSFPTLLPRALSVAEHLQIGFIYDPCPDKQLVRHCAG